MLKFDQKHKIHENEIKNVFNTENNNSSKRDATRPDPTRTDPNPVKKITKIIGFFNHLCDFVLFTSFIFIFIIHLFMNIRTR